MLPAILSPSESSALLLFAGGFLGLDNIGVFDRSAQLPMSGHLDQADGTARMAFYCQNMLEIALILAETDPIYEEIAFRFMEHFVWIRRLRQQGIMCQWLPIHGLKPREYKRIIRSFLDLFPETTLWFVNRFSFLLGQRKASPISFRSVARRLSDERVKNDLKPLKLAEAKQRLDAGDPERACRLYRKALRIDPTSAVPEHNLGAAQFRRGRFDKALHHFKNAAAKTPWNAETRYNLAVCYWKLGRHGPCRLELEKALAHNPGMEKARHALERLEGLHLPA